MFNSLKYAKTLEEVGFTRRQAEAHMEIMTEVIETGLAAKQDVKDLRVEFKLVHAEIRASEYRQTIKLGTIVSVAIAVAVTLVKVIS